MQKNRLETIRSIITALKTAESAPKRRNKLDETELISVLQRLKKQRMESMSLKINFLIIAGECGAVQL